MKKLPTLKPGDSVEIIAPASRCSDLQLQELIELLTSWKLHCVVDKHIFGDDLLCANTDEVRFQLLKKALQNPETNAVICVRGGYGSMRLIPHLSSLPLPGVPKLFVGMSDITALHVFLQQQWQWPTLHAALTIDKFSSESIAAVKSVLFGEVSQVEYSGLPLNIHARENGVIETSITGGNLCMVQASLGTTWQFDGRNKIIFLEEVNERGYRVDRMLEHLHQAHIFKEAKAILFGDFTQGHELDGTSLINPVLERFAERCNIPVIQVKGIGHDQTNYPLPLGTKAILQFGKSAKLRVCFSYSAMTGSKE